MNESRKRHILVLDDSGLIQISVKEALEAEGFSVDTVSTAEEALNMIKQRATAYDLIISDIHLPYKDGISFVEILKKSGSYPNYKEIPVMMLTSDISIRTVKKAIEKGANDYLSKPFTTNDLVNRVKRLISDKEENQFIKLMEILREEIERAKRGDYEITLIVGSKESESGPRAHEIISEIRRYLRKVDTALDLGKSNIALVLPFTKKEGAEVVLEKIRKGVIGKWYFGIANFPGDCKDEKELYNTARESIVKEINAEQSEEAVKEEVKEEGNEEKNG
ncbi:Alkaline phosphatase synthesis transcriptional regulatory protein SphR [Caloramator mitchellensis]|uniref:Stage 0 sporulation protein A homolog n=1 Tax=Caloramator mitchellensis TaxID=908809 RepID=A0A0R3JYC3_CALMK|nr:response regulator [Caloramator mitchellensis]KRQ86222.1 Alkaline phosphatase synthesis transcriptional regulatory protein SphR [Caloramator mitchellensis]